MSPRQLAAPLCLAVALLSGLARAQGAPPDGTGGVSAVDPTAFPDGSESAPSVTNVGDTNTGAWFCAADAVCLSTGGTERFRLTTSTLTLTLPIRAANGSAASASYGFTSQASTGMRLGAVGLLTLQVAATDVMYLSATTIVPNMPMEGPTGSAANTTYGFGSDTNTGTYRIGADHLGLAAGGLKASLSTTDLATEAGIYIKSGAHGAVAPDASACNEDSERHRTYLDHTVSPRRLYVCTGAANGWDHVALTD